MALLQTELKKLLGRIGDTEKKIRELSVLEIPKYTLYNYQGDINPLVNGNMAVNQRVNAVALTTGVEAYTLDQWKAGHTASTPATISVSQQAMSFNETAFLPEQAPPNFLRWTQSTAGAGTTRNRLLNLIQPANLYAGLPVTLSFWAKASTPVTLGVLLTQSATGGAATSTQVFNLTTAWQKFTYNATLGNSITAIGAASVLVVEFDLQFNIIQTVDITNVQLDRGSIANNFKVESLETTLRRCQRFFAKSNAQGIAPGNILFANRAGSFEWQNWTAVVANRAAGTVFLPAVMRVAPTVTFYNPDVAANAFARDMGAALNATTTTTDRIGDRSFNVTYTQNAASAASAFYAVHWTASAEI